MSLLFVSVFIGVMLFLTLVAWFDPAERRVLAGGRRRHADADAGAAIASLTARLLKGERKIEKPCLTPIDCVAENRCAGHCGCR